MEINEKEFLNLHKNELDNAPINSMTPVINDKNEVYFICKMRPSTIIELVHQKREGKIPSRITASISSWIENDNTIVFGINPVEYPFYFETEFYDNPKLQMLYTKSFINQDNFALFLVTEEFNGDREFITGKLFNLRKTMLNGFYKWLEGNKK